MGAAPAGRAQRGVRALAGGPAAETGDSGPQVDVRTGPPELRDLAAAFNRMSTAVTESARTQSRLVADVAHQVRNPMAALLLRMDALSAEVTPDGRAGYESALAEVERLRALLDGMLSMATADSRATAIAAGAPGPAPLCDAAAVIADRADAWFPAADRAGLRLEAPPWPGAAGTEHPESPAAERAGLCGAPGAWRAAAPETAAPDAADATGPARESASSAGGSGEAEDGVLASRPEALPTEGEVPCCEKGPKPARQSTDPADAPPLPEAPEAEGSTAPGRGTGPVPSRDAARRAADDAPASRPEALPPEGGAAAHRGELSEVLSAPAVRDGAGEARNRDTGGPVDGESSTAPGAAAVPVAVAEGELAQMLDIALDNAVKYAGPGARIRIGCAAGPAPDMVRVEVRDDGPGMPDEDLERATRRFWRSGTAPAQGTGLGLAILERLATARGGALTLLPAAPHGLTVAIDLPRAAGRAGDAPLQGRPGEEAR
ncbi:ATP-binding protein [Nocardiopsis composta]